MMVRLMCVPPPVNFKPNFTKPGEAAGHPCEDLGLEGIKGSMKGVRSSDLRRNEGDLNGFWSKPADKSLTSPLQSLSIRVESLILWKTQGFSRPHEQFGV